MILHENWANPAGLTLPFWGWVICCVVRVVLTICVNDSQYQTLSLLALLNCDVLLMKGGPLAHQKHEKMFQWPNEEFLEANKKHLAGVRSLRSIHV